MNSGDSGRTGLARIAARVFVALQYLLPKHLLTALVYRLARVRWAPVKDLMIRRFVAFYGIDTGEFRYPAPEGYATFNDFFIRELAPGAREIDSAPDSIVSPVDGTVSAAGRIAGRQVFQAKGLSYTLDELLATDTALAAQYVDGAFATIYLAPYNYHRVHAPVAGRVNALRYAPGALYSVNDATVRNLPRLFARNERLICHFETGHGPIAFILVGALNVGTINSRWTGDMRPRRTGVVEEVDPARAGAAPEFDKGETIGWFNMGSTVIMLIPPGASDEFAGIRPGQRVRLGEPIGRLSAGR